MLVAAHGNSLRGIVKHLDQISDEDIVGLNIPTGMPLVYRLDEDLRPTVAGGEYLDPEAAKAAAAAVAARAADLSLLVVRTTPTRHFRLSEQRRPVTSCRGN